MLEGSQTLEQIKTTGIADPSVDPVDARNQLRASLRAVYRQSIRSIMVVSKTVFRDK